MLERPGASISGTPYHNRGISSSYETVATPVRWNPTRPDDLCKRLRLSKRRENPATLESLSSRRCRLDEGEAVVKLQGDGSGHSPQESPMFPSGKDLFMMMESKNCWQLIPLIPPQITPQKQIQRRFRPHPNHDKKRKKQQPETLELLNDKSKTTHTAEPSKDTERLRW